MVVKLGAKKWTDVINSMGLGAKPQEPAQAAWTMALRPTHLETTTQGGLHALL